MPTISEIFYCNFLSSVFLFSYCKGSFRRHLSAKCHFWWRHDKISYTLWKI